MSVIDKYILPKWDLWLLVASGVVTLVLHTVGVVSQPQVSSIILMMLTVYVLHTIISSKNESDNIIGKLELINDKLTPSVDVNILENRKELYPFVLDRIKHAKQSVSITHFISTPPNNNRIKERKEYFESIGDYVLENPQIHFRRILSIPNRTNYEWVLQDQLTKLKDTEHFHVRYLDVPDENKLPLYTMVIIDSNEIFLGVYNEPIELSRKDKNIWLRNQELASAFQDYFELLWFKSTILKDGWDINTEELNRLDKKFGITSHWS